MHCCMHTSHLQLTLFVSNDTSILRGHCTKQQLDLLLPGSMFKDTALEVENCDFVGMTPLTIWLHCSGMVLPRNEVSIPF